MAYEQVARLFGFASLDLSGVARMACIFPWVDYIWSMEFSTIWPIVFLLLTYLASRCAKKVDEWTYFAFILVYLVFPSNSSAVLRYFNCVKFDARGDSSRTIKVLMADMSINCRSERYKLTSIFAWVMVAIYPIGIPVLCFATLFWYRKRINPKQAVEELDRLSRESEELLEGPTDMKTVLSKRISLRRLKTEKIISAGVKQRDGLGGGQRRS